MKEIEILAPAGSIEAAYAAIQGGADAIYLAGKMFGARAFALNFSNAELESIVRYAHLYGVKVYITCNILIFEREVSKFLEYVDFLAKINVDALIMQDIGMVDLVHQTYPNLVLHASTQMHIHNVEGAKLAEKLGISRIVLARETEVEVIKQIKKETNLEIEVFVHGALCASFSGVCLFASSIGPRSGNRGTCSGCCRLPYKVLSNTNEVLNQDDYPLSMRDLNTLNYLDELIEAGVDSFKIEGRMKSPSYVYTTTKLYKDTTTNYLKTNKIEINKQDLEDLKNIFWRDYTKGFMLGAKSQEVINSKAPNHQGLLIGEVLNYQNGYLKIKLLKDVSIHDKLRIVSNNQEMGLILNEFKVHNQLVHQALKGDVISLKYSSCISKGAKVYRTSSFTIDEKVKKIIQTKVRKVKIAMTLEMYDKKNIILKVSDFENEVMVKGIEASLAKTKSVTQEDLQTRLLKTSDTIYEVAKLTFHMQDKLFIPLGEINRLRREALALLDEARLEKFKKKYQKSQYQRNVPDFKENKGYTILTNKPLKDSSYQYIYTENENLVNDRYILKLPKVMHNYPASTKQEDLVGELGSVKKLENIITDYSLNVTNSYSVALLHSLGVKRVTLSVELSDTAIEDLIKAYRKRYQKQPNLELIINTNLELMVLKSNFQEIYDRDVAYLVDRFKNKYKIVIKNNLTYIYDYKKTIKKDSEKYFKMGINYLRIENYF